MSLGSTLKYRQVRHTGSNLKKKTLLIYKKKVNNIKIVMVLTHVRSKQAYLVLIIQTKSKFCYKNVYYRLNKSCLFYCLPVIKPAGLATTAGHLTCREREQVSPGVASEASTFCKNTKYAIECVNRSIKLYKISSFLLRH